MKRFSDRVVLVVLALVAAYVGSWALFAPGSFYAVFPGGSRHWVADGPFDEHLVRDVGGLDRALNVVALGGTVVLAALLVLPRRDDAARVVASPAPTAPVDQAGTRGGR